MALHQEADPAPVFVVGTGRCGSTLISNMFRMHPEILSLSEFFTFTTDLGTLIPPAFPSGLIGPEQFWQIISTPYKKQNLMLREKIAMEEVLYPCKPTSRFNAWQGGVPAILQTTLPHLSDDHDALFDEVQFFILSQESAPIQVHYTRLFEWLQHRFGRRVWVERSGSSLRIVKRLTELFPHARFVHIVRDGRNCALSMSRHSGFRMVVISFLLCEILGCDPFESDDREYIGDVPDDLYPFLPEHFDAQAFRAYDAPPSLFGHYWSGEIVQGLEVLAQLPSERVLTLRYEDFLDHFEQAASALISFIDPALMSAHWLQEAHSLIHPAASAWECLPEQEKAFLEASCEPGFQKLKEINVCASL